MSAQSTQESEKSILIVYLSRINNTEAVAEIIRDEVGGDMVELCPDCINLEGFSIKGGLERDGVYLDIKGERREEVRAEVRQWL